MVGAAAAKKELVEESYLVHPPNEESREMDSFGNLVYALFTFVLRALHYMRHIARFQRDLVKEISNSLSGKLSVEDKATF